MHDQATAEASHAATARPDQANGATVPRQTPRGDDAAVVQFPQRRRAAGKPRVEVTNEAEAYETLRDLIGSPQLPQIYRRGGTLCDVDTTTEGDSGDTRLVARVMTPEYLRSYFGDHLDTFSVDQKTLKPGRALVQIQTCKTLLARKESDWRGVPVLRGIVTTPVLRPDGTLLQTPGFDPTTGLYYFRRIELPTIPERPDAEAIAWAAKFISLVLCDFPFKAPSDRAQYIGALCSPLIRHYAPGPTPALVISASAPGSGKSLLTEIFDRLYSVGELTWTDSDAELRKSITSKLIEGGEPVVTFDNFPNGGTIKSPVLAQLLTAKTWGDRKLGTNSTVKVPNDALWIINGNNLRTGADQARRTLWCRLDPPYANPELRDNFTMGDLGIWLKDPEHVADLLGALLVLVTAWAQAGAPKSPVRMGGYSHWASVTGGLLAHAGVDGWLADREETMIRMDREASAWATFYEAWEHVFKDRRVAVRELLLSAELTDAIPRDDDRQTDLPTPQKLGKMLEARDRRFYGKHQAVSYWDSHAKRNLWEVRRDPGAQPESQPE